MYLSHSRGRLASFALSACLVSAAHAQSFHAVEGTIQDPQKAPVAGATVEVLDGPGAVKAGGRTSANGSYKLPFLESGTFTVRVTAPGFRVSRSAEFQIGGTETRRVDLTLQLPTLEEEITVTATGVPTPISQTGASVTLLTADDYPYATEIQQAIRLVPGVQMTQSGQTGSTSSLFLRGADSNATKVVLDGVPLNDVGGFTNFANLASAGIGKVEILRQADSAQYGSDALAGVVSLTTTRGATPLPLFSYAVDGGNYGFFRQQGELSGRQHGLDYYNTFARLNTGNSIASNAYHNASFLGDYGYTIGNTSLRTTIRHLTANGGSPNAFAFYGIADIANQREQETNVSVTAENQTTTAWHNLLRYGHEALHQEYARNVAVGTAYYAYGYLNGYIGNQVTLTGANGYQVSGQGIIDYSLAGANTQNGYRDFSYAQTDYRINPHLVALGAFKYEAERGLTTTPTVNTVDRRNQSYTAQLAGDVKGRFFFVAGSGIEKNEVFGTALTPRLSLAYYLARPGAGGLLAGTKLHASFSKGVKEPAVAEQFSSLHELQKQAGQVGGYIAPPLGAEYSRNYDFGVEQQLANGRARINTTWFHNEYTNGVQYVNEASLITLGYNAAVVAKLAPYGTYANALAFRAEGLEFESEYRLTPRIFARAGYTYLDARIQRSFSSDALAPAFNTSFNFPKVQIGAYNPLVGARPFRRAPHSGYFALSYARQRFTTQVSGSLVGRRDDSTFLSDKDYGNSLLLPNRNLDGGYQKLELDADYKVTSRLTAYVDMQNLLNEKYFEAFGYPALPYNLRGGLKFSFGGESWKLR